jgi:hypothetical protein
MSDQAKPLAINISAADGAELTPLRAHLQRDSAVSVAVAPGRREAGETAGIEALQVTLRSGGDLPAFFVSLMDYLRSRPGSVVSLTVGNQTYRFPDEAPALLRRVDAELRYVDATQRDTQDLLRRMLGSTEVSLGRLHDVQRRLLRLTGEPVSIWLGDGAAHEAVELALSQLLDEMGLEIADPEPPQSGSWYRRSSARVRDATRHLTPEQIAAEIERKLRIELFDKAQAMIDNQEASGAAALITSLASEEKACIRVGSILLIKVDGQLTVTNLTQYQLAWLERNQTLLLDPVTLLQELAKLAGRTKEDRPSVGQGHAFGIEPPNSADPDAGDPAFD